ncbi:hypothetical protein BKI52_14295 [marine bacterium AO1-C]|nr:hypothetical protein BKI52_14295 [marine bacterium AO1-C]
MEITNTEEKSLNKLLGLIKSGQLENIELALAIGKSYPEFQEKLEAYRKFYWVVFGEKITQLTADHLYRLTNQKEVNISDTGLAHLPDEIAILTNMGKLTVANNQLITLPNNIGTLSELVRLDFTNNQIRSLPDSIIQLPLMTLILNENQLKTLPEKFGNFDELMWLSVSHNKLVSLPEDIGRLENLTKLKLNSNQLKQLPGSIGKLQELSLLQISDNQLNVLPDSFGSLGRLKEFFLEKNQFTEIPPQLHDLKNIRTISLSQNPIEHISPDIFYHPTLTYAIFNRCGLKKIDFSSHKNASNITHLYLMNNELESIPASIQSLTKLRFLKLRGNPLDKSQVDQLRQWLPNCRIT